MSLNTIREGPKKGLEDGLVEHLFELRHDKRRAQEGLDHDLVEHLFEPILSNFLSLNTIREGHKKGETSLFAKP